jgi:hypothetical protein
MPEKYYELREYRISREGGWKHLYFSIDEKGTLKIIKRDDNVVNSKLEEISKEQVNRILRPSIDG